MSFDYAAQQAETERLWSEMAAAHDLPTRGQVDLQFKAGSDADATEFMGWLEDEGYDVEHYPADPDGDPEDCDEVIEVQTAPMDLSPATIHAVERRCTEAGLRHGWQPDGWGFIAV